MTLMFSVKFYQEQGANQEMTKSVFMNVNVTRSRTYCAKDTDTGRGTLPSILGIWQQFVIL